MKRKIEKREGAGTQEGVLLSFVDKKKSQTDCIGVQ